MEPRSQEATVWAMDGLHPVPHTAEIHENKISVRSRKVNSTGKKKAEARQCQKIENNLSDGCGRFGFRRNFQKTRDEILESHMLSALPCKYQEDVNVFPQMQQCDGHRRKAILCQEKDHKTIYEHKIEAHESRRCHIQESEKRGHEDHLAKNSLNHYNRLRQSIRFLQAMKMPDERAAVDKEWGRWRNLPAWRESKPNSKEEVFEQAQKE